MLPTTPSKSASSADYRHFLRSCAVRYCNEVVTIFRMRLSVPVVALALALIACQNPSPDRLPDRSASQGPITVAVQLPQRRSLQTNASLTGEFRPYQQVDLYSKVSGYLRKIDVDAGSRVRAGDVIALLDAPELQAEVEQAAAGRKRAESELTRAKAEVPRFVPLL